MKALNLFLLLLLLVYHHTNGQNFQWSNSGGNARPWPWAGEGRQNVPTGQGPGGQIGLQAGSGQIGQQSGTGQIGQQSASGQVGQQGPGGQIGQQSVQQPGQQGVSGVVNPGQNNFGSPNQQAPPPNQQGPLPNQPSSNWDNFRNPVGPNQQAIQQGAQPQSGQQGLPPQTQLPGPTWQQGPGSSWQGQGPQTQVAGSSWQQGQGTGPSWQQVQQGQPGPNQGQPSLNPSDPRSTGQQPNQVPWYGDPNRPPDSQVWPNQPVGPSMHTSADKTIMRGPGNQQSQASWNQQPQWNQPPNNWNQQPQSNWNQQQGQQWRPQWQQSGPGWQQGQQNLAPQQPGLQQGPAGPQQPWEQQPLWVPGQQGWITNTQPAQSTVSYIESSTTPYVEDNTQFILNDLLSFHIGGAFPRDEIRQYNAKVPMPRYRKDYWLGEIYYNLDPASQLEGKVKCTYPLPQALQRLHYDDGTPIGVIVFQCVQFQQKCCNMDCCNLYPKPTSLPQFPQYPGFYGRGAGCTCSSERLFIVLLLLTLRLAW